MTRRGTPDSSAELGTAGAGRDGRDPGAGTTVRADWGAQGLEKWTVQGLGLRGTGAGWAVRDRTPGERDWPPPRAQARALCSPRPGGEAVPGPGSRCAPLRRIFRSRGQRDNQELGLSLHPEVGRVRRG